MKRKPNISVIMPVFNGSQFLTKSIESILGQTNKDFELIIIDDGSTDSSLSIIKKYQGLSEKIVLLKFQKNKGISGALNAGIRIARGDFIARQDSDDISMPNRLSTQTEYLLAHPEIHLVGSAAYVIDEEDALLGQLNKKNDPQKIKRTLLRTNTILHPTIMFRNTNEFWYREKAMFCEDYDLYLNMLSSKKILTNLEEPLIKYRIHNKSLGSQYASVQKIFVAEVKDWYKERTKGIQESYDLFRSQEILKKSKENIDKTNGYFKRMVIFYIKIGNIKEAKMYFQRLREKEEQKSPKDVFLWLCIKFPFFYKIYRKIVFGYY